MKTRFFLVAVLSMVLIFGFNILSSSAHAQSQPLAPAAKAPPALKAYTPPALKTDTAPALRKDTAPAKLLSQPTVLKMDTAPAAWKTYTAPAAKPAAAPPPPSSAASTPPATQSSARIPATRAPTSVIVRNLPKPCGECGDRYHKVPLASGTKTNSPDAYGCERDADFNALMKCPNGWTKDAWDYGFRCTLYYRSGGSEFGEADIQNACNNPFWLEYFGIGSKWENYDVTASFSCFYTRETSDYICGANECGYKAWGLASDDNLVLCDK
jgi:hypothetical protein